MAIDRLVHKAKTAGRAQQLFDAPGDFVIVVRSENLGDDAHGPSHARAKMGATSRVDNGPVGVVAVRLA